MPESSRCPTALVARTLAYGADQGRYLILCPEKGAQWIDDPTEATVFPTLAEAICAALSLNSGAYAMMRHHGLALSARN